MIKPAPTHSPLPGARMFRSRPEDTTHRLAFQAAHAAWSGQIIAAAWETRNRLSEEARGATNEMLVGVAGESRRIDWSAGRLGDAPDFAIGLARILSGELGDDARRTAEMVLGAMDLLVT